MPPSSHQIDTLIEALAAAQLKTADAFNQYAPGDGNNAIRRSNLRLYLQALSQRQPAALLLMEAPGYRGCRLTGIPVTSRKIMLEGIPALNCFGAGFRDVKDSGFENVAGEQSATIVWSALADLNAMPLIWNTFPFHPHKPGQPLSNRKPRQPEIELGVSFLQPVLELWRFEMVVAVGNVAYDTLVAQGIGCAKVRHPAHGGKHAFVAGLKTLLSVGA